MKTRKPPIEPYALFWMICAESQPVFDPAESKTRFLRCVASKAGTGRTGG